MYFAQFYILLHWPDYTYSYQVIVNVDGASKGNPGMFAIGEISRTYQSKYIAAFYIFLGKYGSNGLADARTFLQGIKVATDRGLSHFLVHTDSLMNTNCILSKNHIPWLLNHILQEVIILVQMFEFLQII